MPPSPQVELLLCCGDFQALRTADDFASLAVPAKYRQLGDFSAYFRGEKTAPVLTLFVGGNHEASNYLQVGDQEGGGWKRNERERERERDGEPSIGRVLSLFIYLSIYLSVN